MIIGKYEVEQGRIVDILEIIDVNGRAFDGGDKGVRPITPDQVQSWINNFPHGLQVARLNGRIVAVGMAIALKASRICDDWYLDTDCGYCTTHRADGDTLYGVTLTSLSPGAGGAIIVAARRMLPAYLPGVQQFCLHSRLSGMSTWLAKDPTRRPEDYPWKEDRTLQFYESCGFTPDRLVARFFAEDEESCGYAGHMVWRVP